jgi:hypothetical protein
MIIFSVGKLIAVPTRLADGTAIATPTPVRLATLQDISLDMSVEMKTLYGSKRYPIAVGQGKGKISLKAKTAEIDGKVLGSLFYGKAAAAGIKAAVMDNAQTIPASSAYEITVVPPNSGTFVSDLGILLAADGTQMTRVATGATPTAGQYSVTAAGKYVFAAADASKGILQSYEYSATSTTGEVFNITNETMGYSPSFTVLLQTQYDGKNLVVKLNRCVSGKLNLPLKNDDFTLFDFEAEAFSDAADNVGYICLF